MKFVSVLWHRVCPYLPNGAARLFLLAGFALLTMVLGELNFQQTATARVIQEAPSNTMPKVDEVKLMQPGSVAGAAVSSQTSATGTASNEQTDTDGTPITENGLPRHDYDPSIVPKSTKSLIFSPSSVVIYRTANGFYPQGVKSGIVGDIPLQISTSDGANMVVPFSQNGAGVLQPADRAAAEATWNFIVNSTYASFGTNTYTVTSRSPSGLTAYAGTIQVEVRPMPVFSISGTTLSITVATTPAGTAEISINGVSYTGSADGDRATMSVSLSGSPCTNISFQSGVMHCTNSYGYLYGTYPVSIFFDNQFQHVEFSGSIKN